LSQYINHYNYVRLLVWELLVIAGDNS